MVTGANGVPLVTARVLHRVVEGPVAGSEGGSVITQPRHQVALLVRVQALSLAENSVTRLPVQVLLFVIFL